MIRDEILLDNLEIGQHRQFWQYVPPGTYPVDTQVTYTTLRTKIARKDVVTPQFKKRCGNGEIINNPYHYRMFSARPVPLFIFGAGYYPGSNVLEKHEYVFDPTEFLGLLRNADQTWASVDEWIDEHFSKWSDIAVDKAWSRVDVSKLQALASLGEAPETVKWLADILKRFVKLLRLILSPAYRNKEIAKLLKKGFNPGDVLSNIWLEWRYAVRPLIFEAQSALEALNTSLDKTLRYTARAKLEHVGQDSKNIIWNNLVHGEVITFSYSQTVTCASSAGVLYNINSDVDEWLAVLGLDSPISSAYELIPFSFIADWFWNIGDVVAAFESRASVLPKASWCTQTIRVDTTYTPISVSSAHWGYNQVAPLITNEGSLVSTVSEFFKRRVVNPPRALMPHVNIRLNVGKITDLIAIGRGLLSRKN